MAHVMEPDVRTLRQLCRENGFDVSHDGRVSHKAAAFLLGVHCQTLHRYVGDGDIRRERVAHAGSQFSYRLSAVAELLGLTIAQDDS